MPNVATPLAAATLVVPPRVPPPGLFAIARATVPVNDVAVLPSASCAVTCTAGVIAAPAVVLDGSTVKTSCAAAPGVMVNVALVAPVSPLALAASVYPVPVLLILKFENAATPFSAATVVVPESAPPPGFAPKATVMFPVKVGSVFPCASCAAS